ncbi:hypothetical protein T492DRAFT_844893 [Pavlovales sp. CCMP2436]|nr:hypothetical protein T492DRAFT_844893 [Pavlovales sp. CCMP2436]
MDQLQGRLLSMQAGPSLPSSPFAGPPYAAVVRTTLGYSRAASAYEAHGGRAEPSSPVTQQRWAGALLTSAQQENEQLFEQVRRTPITHHPSSDTPILQHPDLVWLAELRAEAAAARFERDSALSRLERAELDGANAARRGGEAERSKGEAERGRGQAERLSAQLRDELENERSAAAAAQRSQSKLSDNSADLGKKTVLCDTVQPETWLQQEAKPI